MEDIYMIHHDSSSFGQSNWDENPQDFFERVELQNPGFSINPNPAPPLPEHPNPSPTPDLLSLLHLPRCSGSVPLLPHSSIPLPTPSLSDIMAGSCVTYDPLFHLNLPQQPPLIPTNDSYILEFTKDISGCARKGRGSRKNKHFPTERERRNYYNDKFDALKKLIPNLTRTDRASILADAIEHIKELLRRVSELKYLVERKRCGKQRNKRQETEENPDNPEIKAEDDVDQSFNSNSLRCSWLQRKSKVTEVDVRIIDDEVTVKIVQKKKINCLLFVSKVLDQLQLDLHHVGGGQIGEHYSFLFHTKIYEGSTIYASAIASRVIEVVDKQYMAALPMNNY